MGSNHYNLSVDSGLANQYVAVPSTFRINWQVMRDSNPHRIVLETSMQP